MLKHNPFGLLEKIVKILLVIAILLNLVIVALSFFEGGSANNYGGGGIAWALVFTIPVALILILIWVILHLISTFFPTNQGEVQSTISRPIIVSKRFILLGYLATIFWLFWKEGFNPVDPIFEVLFVTITFFFSSIIYLFILKRLT